MRTPREAMARAIWDASYPHLAWPQRHRGLSMAYVWGAADTVLHVLDRAADQPVERLEMILQEILFHFGVNNPLSGAARLVDGPLARWVA